jgi:acylpyruvate hydrolase
VQDGDLLLTGTPSGVGPIKDGDVITCSLWDLPSGKELSKLKFNAAGRAGGYEYKP